MMRSTVSFTTAGPSEDQWKNYQSLITQLYQSKSLKEVMKVLERDFEFKASEKMYKSRICKWQIDKKRKRPEMLFAKKVIEERRQEGKSTQITIRGQNLAETDVLKYFKRQKTSTTSDAVDAENAPTPPELSYSTPVLQSIPLIPPFGQQVGMDLENEKAYDTINTVPNNLESVYPTVNISKTYGISMNEDDSTWPVYTFQPELKAIRSNRPMPWVAQNDDDNLETLWGTPASDVVSGSTHGRYSWQSSFLGTDVALQPYELAACTNESTLHHIYAYINLYYFNSDKWLPHKNQSLGQPKLKYAVEEGKIKLQNPVSLQQLILDATQLFDSGHIQPAVSSLDSACAMIHSLVKEQHPQLLSKLLVAISFTKAAKYRELIQAVLLHFYDMADVMFGPRHPFTQLVCWLSKALAQSLEVSDVGLRVLRDGYIQHAGHDHPESLEVMSDEAGEMSRRGNLIEAEIMFSNLQQLYESRLGPLNWGSRKMLIEMSRIHFQRGDLASAKYLFEEQYGQLMQCKGKYRVNQDKVHNLRLRALICEQRYEHAEMRVLINEAWNLGTATLTADDTQMLILARDFPAAEWHTAQHAE